MDICEEFLKVKFRSENEHYEAWAEKLSIHDSLLTPAQALNPFSNSNHTATIGVIKK